MKKNLSCLLICLYFFSFRTPSQACNANRRRASTAGLDSNPNDLDTWNNFQEKLPSWQIFRFEFLKLYTKYIFESIHAIPWTVIFQFQPKLYSAKYAILIQKVHTCRIYSRLTTCLMQNNSITQGKVVQGIRYSKQVYKYIWDCNYFEDVVYIQKMQIIHIFNNVQEKNQFCIWLIYT